MTYIRDGWRVEGSTASVARGCSDCVHSQSEADWLIICLIKVQIDLVNCLRSH